MEYAGCVEQDEPAEEESKEGEAGVTIGDGGSDGDACSDEGEAGEDDPVLVVGDPRRDERSDVAGVHEVLGAEDDHGEGEEDAARHEGEPGRAAGGESVEDESGGREGEVFEEGGAAVCVVEDEVGTLEVEG